MKRLRTEPLSLDEVFRAVQRSDAGGVALFVGVVRDHNDGDAVSELEYEAYEAMAEKELEEVIAQVHAEVPAARVEATHRVGRLGVGDVAVVCAASAAHRKEAFEACRLLIDTLKHRVPIWKRERGPGGAKWIDWVPAPGAGEG